MIGVIRLIVLVWLVFISLLLAVDSYAAKPCTWGTNCKCDELASDTAIQFCEDWDAPTLYQNVGFGVTSISVRGSGGTNAYGPAYDASGSPAGSLDRGFNWYWQRRGQAFTDNAHWQNGTPSSPTLGPVCGFSLCNGVKSWHPSDLWNANNLAPPMGILQTGDFDDEIAGMVNRPTNALGGTNGHFDGNYSVFWRTPIGNTAGLNGIFNWTNITDEVGITMAMAMATNVDTQVCGGNWKFTEWLYGGSTPADPPDHSGMFLFYQGGGCAGSSGAAGEYPFHNWIYYSTSGSQGGCDSAIAAATVRRGRLFCDGPVNGQGLGYRPNTTQGFYNQQDKWPHGTWGCVRASFDNMNTSLMTVKFWFQGPNDSSETLIIDFDINPSNFAWTHGVNGIEFDNYSNANSGGTPTTAVSGRYEDNIVIRAGAPVTCAQIGFGAAASSRKYGLEGGARMTGTWRVE